MRPHAWRTVGVALALAAGCGPGASAPPPPSDAFELRLAVVGPGTVDVHGGERCAAACKYAVPAGGAVTLTAVPDDGAAFQGWAGGCSGTGSCTVTLDAHVDVTATFVQPPPDQPPVEPPPPPPPAARGAVEVALEGEGDGRVTSAPAGIDCGGACRAELDAGARVTLTAAPAAGSTFAGWGGSCSGTGACALTVDEGKTVRATARFDRAAPALAYEVKEIALPPGEFWLVDLNEEGDALGTYMTPGGVGHPFLYDGATGTVRILEDVGGIHGAYAVAMNDAGAILASDMGHPRNRVIRWQAGAQTVIELPDGELFAADLGNQGWVVGSLLREGQRGRAFVYDGTAIRELGSLGQYGCHASAVNGLGDIVGQCDGMAIRWVDGEPVDLGLEPRAAALDLTENRLAAGSAALEFKVPRLAFVADLGSGTVTRVPPPAGWTSVEFLHVNARGDAIAVAGFRDREPMLWSGGTFTPLPALTGLDLKDAQFDGLNDRGQIAAHGFDGTRWRNVILTPRP